MALAAESAKVPERQVDPLALTVAQAAAILSATGQGRVTQKMIREHIAAGAPTAGGGRINLLHYAAWLNQRLARTRNGA